ncbi:MAG TPA: TetR/AcrR family transcriptional regulator [Byssovorax sp.]
MRKPTKPARPRGRGAPVVRDILDAALEELAIVGYDALRFEHVAARASVNKTTIYRRWPTKPELVSAALLSIPGDAILMPDTGSLRGDLLEMGRLIMTFTRASIGKGLARLFIAAEPDSELLKIARSLRDSFAPMHRGVMRRAISRGELSPEVDGLLLVDLIDAAITHRFHFEHFDVDEGYVERVVDAVLGGAMPPATRPRAKKRAPQTRPVAPPRARSRAR